MNTALQIQGHCSFFFGNHCSYEFICFYLFFSWLTFRYSLMIPTVTLFPLEHCETQLLFSNMPVPGSFSPASNSIKVEASFS